MAVARRAAPTTQASLIPLVERSMEVLWLLTALLIPLIFVPTDFITSESVNAYVEVPKTTTLRILVGMMTILWIVEWVLKGGLDRRYSIASYSTRITNWVREQPTRWVVVAATVYITVVLISTFLSTAFYTSVWGEVSAQFGYSAYTTLSYFLLFAIIVTHVKTRGQLWRLTGAIVAVGAIVAIYGIFQRYGLDPWDLGETGSDRITGTMANPVFTGSFLVIPSLFTFGLWLMALDKWWQSRWKESAVPVTALGALAVAQFIAVYWTGSRGSWVLGVPPGLLAFPVLASMAFGWRWLARILVIIGAGLVIALFVAFGPNPLDWISSIKSQAAGPGLSHRTEIWEGSLKLIWNRPWFEYESLSLSFFRPLVGYGPEMFKYTFPLESPVGGLLSHSHNFFLHHWVEQGVLGLFSSLGLFFAFFAVGVTQLWRDRDVYSAPHKWLLVALMATMVGRLGEIMVGVARESDLVPFWIMLAIFVVLPSVMRPSDQPRTARRRCPTCASENPTDARYCIECGSALGSPEQETSQTLAVTGQDRRHRRRERRERRARRFGKGTGSAMTFLQIIGLASVLPVLIFVGWLTWDKNANYFWAGRQASQARDTFKEGNFQDSHQIINSAISKAPDIPFYYHNLAGIYDSFRQFKANNPNSGLPPCQQFFSLETRGNAPQVDTKETRCAEEAYLANLKSVEKNRNSPQAKLNLANSTMKLALLGFETDGDETLRDKAIRLYTELTQMVPWSWPFNDALGAAYLSLGQPEKALAPLDRSLAITTNSAVSGQAHYLKGRAYEQLSRHNEAVASFRSSLKVAPNASNVPEIRLRLVQSYNQVATNHINQIQTNEQALKETLDALEKSLAITQETSASGTALYLQGIAHRESGDLAEAAKSLEHSLELDANGPNAAEVHKALAAVYADLGMQAKADEHSKLYEELT